MKARHIWVAALTAVVLLGLILIIVVAASREGEYLPSGTSYYGGRIGVVDVKGMIIDSGPTCRWIEKLRRNPSIRAVVVRIESTGGGVSPSQEIYRALLRTRKVKPVVASMGSVAASGGYYVACASTRIVANGGTLTGSIGVLLTLGDYRGLMKKIGVEFIVLKSGRFKDAGSPFKKMTDEEKKHLQGILADVHNQFIIDVYNGRRGPLAAQGKKLTLKVIKDLADARIFTGRRAKDLKLVDVLGGFAEAVEIAARLAKIKGRPRLIRRPKEFSLWKTLRP